MERIKTGIPGLDDLMDGGIPKGSMILVSGPAGTLKTMISSQFIYRGAKEFDEAGVYVVDAYLDRLWLPGGRLKEDHVSCWISASSPMVMIGAGV